MSRNPRKAGQNPVPAGNHLSDIIRNCLRELRFCRRTVLRLTGCSAQASMLRRHNTFFQLLFNAADTLGQGIVVCFHLRSAETYQCDFNENPLLCRVLQLTGKCGKNPDIAHQNLWIHHLRLLLQKRQVLGRHIQNILHIVRASDKQQIAQIPGKIRDKLPRFPTFHDHIFHRTDRSRDVAGQDPAQQTAEHLRIHGPQRLQNFIVCKLLPKIKCNALVKQA